MRQKDAYKSCEIVAIPVVYYPVQFAMPIQKGSEFVELFAFYTNKLIETGSVKQIINNYISTAATQDCIDYSGKPLGINQCFTAFLLLIVGSCVSLVWFW